MNTEIRQLLTAWDAAANHDALGFHNGGGFAMDNWQLIRADLRALLDAAEQPTDEWEYGAVYESIEGKWFSMDSHGFTIREAGESQVSQYDSPSEIRLGRRRKAGPWEVVPDGE